MKNGLRKTREGYKSLEARIGTAVMGSYGILHASNASDQALQTSVVSLSAERRVKSGLRLGRESKVNEFYYLLRKKGTVKFASESHAFRLPRPSQRPEGHD